MSALVEVTTWSRSRRHLSNPDSQTYFQGTLRMTPLCQAVEADTEAGWTERYPMFWHAVKPFSDLPACKRCEKRAES